MTREKWLQVKHIVQSALDLEPGRAREAFLADSCGSDADVRAEVDALLSAHQDAGGFLETSGVAVPSDIGVTLPRGTRLGVYETTGFLGAGGMGEVYRARDTRLGRDVAIKVLSGAFIGSAERISRLQREARVLATLNHQHIGAIYGIEESSEDLGLPAWALVLELVEGETLAERIARSREPKGPPFKLNHILGIASQIAGALEAAHEKGIVHRDLKPANIKITPDGVVKVLDFGLAMSGSDDGTGRGKAQAATVTGSFGGLTEAATVTGSFGGLIVGTIAYMCPEQAQGARVDKRADIWAFGCVLYEMLTGKAAWARGTVEATLAAIMEQEPDWQALPPGTPQPVRRVLERCLKKDPKLRLRDIGDAHFELLETDPSTLEETTTQRRGLSAWTRAGAAAVIALIGVAVGAGSWWIGRNDSAAPRVTRFVVDLPEGQVIPTGFNANLALSPDGTHLAYTPLPGPVYIRALHDLESRTVEGSEAPGFRSAPLFSPAGDSVSFIEGNAIFSWSRPFLKAALSGGAALKLADYDAFHRGDWGDDGNIYWTAQYPGGIARIPESGGRIESVTTLDAGQRERSHRFASLLPGGESLIYTVAAEGMTTYDDARIDLWDLNTGERTPLISGGTSPVYSPTGHIVYARAGKLFAVAFDAERRRVVGPSFEVLDGVLMSGNTGSAQFSLSKNGDLAYVPGRTDGGRRQLVWVDRAGNEEPLPLPPAAYLYPKISPDGRTLAVEIEGPNHDFYLYDFERTVLSRVTNDGMSHNPVWTRDGERLAFRSWQAGGMTMWWMPADRSEEPERLEPGGTRQSPVSFSPDGNFLTFDQKDPQTQDDAWILPIEGEREPQPLSRSDFGEGSAKFSPDGRWIAYASNESGQSEVWVQPFPGLGPKIQISNDGGYDPVWRPSGGELYYRSGNKMMAVTVTTFPEFRASAPTELWEGLYSSGSASSCGMPGISSLNYDVTADGERFLMVRDDDDTFATQIVVVLNWTEELKAKAEQAALTRPQ